MVEYPPGIDQAPREPGPREVKYVHSASVYYRALRVTAALTLALILGFSAWNTALIRHGQVQNHTTIVNTAAAASDARVTANAVRSCVTPGMPCFDRAQRRTADAVASINRVVILAAACAVGVPPTLSVADRQSAIQTCVIDRLAAGRP